MNKIQQIKKQIKNECLHSKHIEDWFYDIHLLSVEQQAKWLLAKLPKANKEVVMLGVWLHDLQHIRGIKGQHEEVGAKEAVKVMEQYDYDAQIIKQVKKIILSHSCFNRKPTTLEAKILSTADAMAHYHKDFYLQIAVTGKRNLADYKSWILEKLDRNYNKKIQFTFAKQKIKIRHDLYKKVFTMK